MNRLVLFLAFLLILALSQQCDIRGCLTCDDQQKCTACDRNIGGFNPIPFNDGTACQCSASQGFFDEDQDYCSICELLIPSCHTCQVISNAVQCSTCLSGFQKNDTDGNCYSGQCEPKFPGCATCDDTKCLTCHASRNLTLSSGNCDCAKGYQPISPGEKYCAPSYWWYPGCSVCSWSLSCTQCDSDKFFQKTPETSNNNGEVQCQCIKGYFMQKEQNYFETSICTPCSQKYDNCDECDGQKCLACSDGSSPDDSGKCASPCSLVGCSECQSSSVCKTCSQDGFFQSDGNSGCKCRDAYFLKDGQCASCSQPIPGCLSCDDNQTCTRCDTDNQLTLNDQTKKCDCGVGRFLNGTNCGLCSEALSNCQECSEISACSKCRDAYFQEEGGSCGACSVGCKMCNYHSFCNECASESNFEPDGNNRCKCKDTYLLKDEQCVSCSQQIPGCLGCDDDQTCTRCDTDNQFTLNDQTKKCDCGVDRFLNGTDCGLCSQALSNCQECTRISFCSKCDDGYYTTDGGSCGACSVGCKKCTGSSSCLECVSENNFQSNGNNGCKCKDGYFLNGTQCSLCESSMVGCQLCADSGTCTTCNTANNFTLNEGTGKCDCLQRYFLNGTACGLCRLAIGYCDECSNGSTCTDCQVRYFVDQDNLCAACSVGCLNCVSETECTVCDEEADFELDGEGGCKCEDGYFLNSVVCVPCKSVLVGCDLCLNNRTCTLCNNAQNFDMDVATNTCHCRETYFLNANQSCTKCFAQIRNCYRCSNMSHCSSCTAPYTEAFNTSTSITQCQLCNDTLVGCNLCASPSVCTDCDSSRNFVSNGSRCQCRSGFYLIAATSNCGPCSTFSPNCLTCSSSGCTTCIDNYSVNGTGCSRRCLIPGCLRCWNNVCTLCAPFSTLLQNRQACVCDAGYFMNGDECEVCSSLPNCTQCSSANICSECQDGYELNEGTGQCEQSEFVLKLISTIAVLTLTILML